MFERGDAAQAPNSAAAQPWNSVAAVTAQIVIIEPGSLKIVAILDV